MTENTYFLIAVGETLTTCDIDPASARLARRSKVCLPAKVQYAWRHPRLAVLYVVSSDGGPRQAGAVNHATAFTVDPTSGALSALGEAQPLPARPIHCTVDAGGRFLVVGYNNPSSISVLAIDMNGGLSAPIAQMADIDFSIYGHQVRMLPADDTVCFPVRGYDETEDTPADTGALITYGLDGSGQLSPRQSLSPFPEFGPRHLDIHVNGRWLYLSVERQNQVQMYAIGEDGASLDGPRFTVGSLSGPRAPDVRQIASAIRVHPNGCTLYQANRSDRFHERDGWHLGYVGEDSIAVYALDPDSGEPKAIQHAPVRGIHVRTVSIHPEGRLLIAATIQPVPVATEGGGVELVPAALTVFRIGEDGRLERVRSYDIDTAGKQMFWTGMVSVAGG